MYIYLLHNHQLISENGKSTIQVVPASAPHNEGSVELRCDGCMITFPSALDVFTKAMLICFAINLVSNIFFWHCLRISVYILIYSDLLMVLHVFFRIVYFIFFVVYLFKSLSFLIKLENKI